MPHDANDEEVKAGDEVIFHARVRDVYPVEDGCNATFVISGIIARNGSKEYPAVVTCNTRMCEKVEKSVLTHVSPLI